MRCNAGGVERTIRAVAGVALLIAGYTVGLPAWAMIMVCVAGAIALAGAVGRCVVCPWVGLAPCGTASPERHSEAEERMNAAAGMDGVQRCAEARAGLVSRDGGRVTALVRIKGLGRRNHGFRGSGLRRGPSSAPPSRHGRSFKESIAVKKMKRHWSGDVTKRSNALDLDEGVFTWKDPKQIAASLKQSADRSRRRKGTPYQSAMSMLTFYINRAGDHLDTAQRAVLERAKTELRRLFLRT